MLSDIRNPLCVLIMQSKYLYSLSLVYLFTKLSLQKCGFEHLDERACTLRRNLNLYPYSPKERVCMVGAFISVGNELGNVLLLDVPSLSQSSFLADASVRLFKTSMYGLNDACAALS